MTIHGVTRIININWNLNNKILIKPQDKIELLTSVFCSGYGLTIEGINTSFLKAID